MNAEEPPHTVGEIAEHRGEEAAEKLQGDYEVREITNRRR